MASQSHLIDSLNQFLRLTRTAKLQYEQHLALIEHDPAQDIIADIIADKNQHIQWLVAAIEGNGGSPSATTDELALPEEFEHMMREDYDMEASIIREFEHHLEEIWDPQLRALIQLMLEQAQGHQSEFRGMLEDFGTDEFMIQPA